MTREIILVEVVHKFDMSTSETKAFNKTDEAEAYFRSILEKWGISDGDIEDSLDDGFYDDERTGDDFDSRSLIIKEISFEDV